MEKQLQSIILQTQHKVGEHTEEQLRQRQGRDAHLEREGVGVLPSEEKRSQEAVKSSI